MGVYSWSCAAWAELVLSELTEVGKGSENKRETVTGTESGKNSTRQRGAGGRKSKTSTPPTRPLNLRGTQGGKLEVGKKRKYFLFIEREGGVR